MELRKRNALKQSSAEKMISVREWLSAIGSLLGGLGFFIAAYALVMSQRSLAISQGTLQSSVMTTLYSLGQESDKFFVEHPELLEYFYRDDRDPKLTDKELMAKFHSLTPERQGIINTVCEMLADHADLAFLQRRDLPSDEWNNWWSYMSDLYDESPVFRAFLERRSNWYSIDEALKNKNRRSAFRSRKQ